LSGLERGDFMLHLLYLFLLLLDLLRVRLDRGALACGDGCDETAGEQEHRNAV
jgi:hypothetical protein